MKSELGAVSCDELDSRMYGTPCTRVRVACSGISMVEARLLRVECV